MTMLVYQIFNVLQAKQCLHIYKKVPNSAAFQEKSSISSNPKFLILSYNIYIINDSMYRASPAAEQAAESIHKDALISALKKELYDLQDKQHEYLSLNDDVHNLESRFAILKEDKERIQSQHRIKIDLNRKNIADLRSQIDAIKMQIHKCSVQIQDNLRECAGLKRACDNRQSQIASSIANNRDLDSKNQQLAEQNKSKMGKIKNLKQERNRCDAESQRLQRNLEQAIVLLKTLEKEARALESGNTKLSSILLVAQNDHSNLIEEMRTRDEMVNNTNKKLDHLHQEVEALRDRTNRLEKECLKNQQDFRNTSEELQLCINKNKDLTKRLKQSQNTLRSVENEYDKAVLQRDALQNENESLHTQHTLLNTDIDSLLRQIIEYEKINSEMQRQIEHYIQCDQEARNMLDRRGAMKTMLDTVSARLGQTGANISHLR